MTLPTFILAGVEKSGSTSLYRYLQQHPGIYMAPVKEPDFFLRSDLEASIHEYAALFEGATTETAIGEASVGYFNDSETPHRIQRILPDATILLVLRNPIERAYSHYNMLVIHGVAPPPPYATVLRNALTTSNLQNTGIPTSRYAGSLEAYQTVFGSNLNVYFYDDFRRDPSAFVRQVYSDIGVDPEFVPNLETTYNGSYRPRSGRLSAASFQDATWKRIVRQIMPSRIRLVLRSALTTYNQQPVPRLDDETRQLAYELLQEDIERTETLLQRDLSNWKPSRVHR
jgi:hypothetical protein